MVAGDVGHRRPRRYGPLIRAAGEVLWACEAGDAGEAGVRSWAVAAVRPLCSGDAYRALVAVIQGFAR